MNAPFFGCCGWAASSIVPTKRYKTYTKQLFDDFSRVNTLQIDEESLEENIIEDEDWPLTLKHSSLVKKTVEYVKFNHDKLPKMGRKLRARAQKGLRTGDVRYTSVAVVLMKKVVKEANSAVQMDYYLTYFLEVIHLLVRSAHNILRYQAVSLLKLILEQPLFSSNNSGIVHYEKIFHFAEVIQELSKEYYLNFLLNHDKKNDTNLLLISNCYICLSYLLELANRFKLDLEEEERLFAYCSQTLGNSIMKDEHNFSKLLEDFEKHHALPPSFSTFRNALLGLFLEMNTANRISKHIIENLLQKNGFCSPESVHSILTELRTQILVSKGKTSYFYETLMDACTALYSKDVVQACNLINYLVSGGGRIANEVDLTSKAFEQWLFLHQTAVQEDDKELKQSTLGRLACEFVSSTGDVSCRLRCLCVLEKWSTSEKIEGDELEKLLKELEELGFHLDYKPCSFEVKGIVLKDSPMEMKDPNICPYERQIILEEMLLALGSGSI